MSDSLFPKNDLPRVLEFFAGGGFALKGLEDSFHCVFANDNDPLKARVYGKNFGSAGFDTSDVWALSPNKIPDAELAWASFPCQDISIAGYRKGLNAPRSSAFWGFWRLIEAMNDDERGPNTLALENVAGLISSRRGRDFIAVVETLADAGYRVGAMVIDAALFSPQSRQRLFIIAHKGRIPDGLESNHPDPLYHPENLQKVVARMDPTSRLAWTWWKLPKPDARTVMLEDVLDRKVPQAQWRSEEATQKLIDQMSPAHRAKFDAALKQKTWRAGAVYRRIRMEDGSKVQRAEIRYDGLAGCLRTPAGGSSKQLLMITHKGKARLRALNAREAARLMGLNEDYILPEKETPALQVIGDAVSVPVVKWLSENLLSPLTKAHLSNTNES
ncbi:DNA cytosine methyltransferase [Hirschia litorea]|uniref:DNA (cytosine-5-)-methyltransferase n=1 Tax=Hirschia litorea TaxID=1199156 RepID=A0ABW2IJQ4_9PROT